MRRPTAAERARTLAYGIAGGAIVTVAQEHSAGSDAEMPYEPVPAHVTDHCGRPLLLMPTASPVVRALRGEPDLAATLRICDVAPVSLADRLRGRVWLHGWLTVPDGDDLRAAALRLSKLHARTELLDVQDGKEGPWTVLAMEIAEVEISDTWGHTVLEPEQYEQALPDPFVAIEHGMLSHLDECHQAELTALFRERFGPVTGEPVVRPLALDRYGLWLRCLVAAPHGQDRFDLYVEFPSPVRDIHGLRRVCRRLLAPAPS